MKITPETVKERIAALESAGDLSLKEQFYLEALRHLMAAMDGEPVADVVAWSHPNEESKCDIRWRRHDVEPGPLYRHAQPAPVVPEEMPCGGAADDYHDGYQDGWNACRAAMLPATPVCTCPSGDGSLRWPCPVHPGNSPVVPDGIERVASMAEYLGNFAAAAIIRQLAANQQQDAQQNIPEIIPDSCTWTFSNYDDHWSGTCGVEWIFPDGGPEENGVKFCPKCGKSVAVSATEGTEE